MTEVLMSSAAAARRFEELARVRMGEHYSTPLYPGRVGTVPKLFDLVSADGRVAGDAKYYALVGGERLPSAKLSVIAEYVWMLEKSSATTKFLVFGNDIKVPRAWLARYGTIVNGVDFFFLAHDGALSPLTPEA